MAFLVSNFITSSFPLAFELGGPVDHERQRRRRPAWVENDEEALPSDDRISYGPKRLLETTGKVRSLVDGSGLENSRTRLELVLSGLVLEARLPSPLGQQDVPLEPKRDRSTQQGGRVIRMVDLATEAKMIEP
jgi:hypothetical protein